MSTNKKKEREGKDRKGDGETRKPHLRSEMEKIKERSRGSRKRNDPQQWSNRLWICSSISSKE